MKHGLWWFIGPVAMLGSAKISELHSEPEYVIQNANQPSQKNSRNLRYNKDAL